MIIYIILMALLFVALLGLAVVVIRHDIRREVAYRSLQKQRALYRALTCKQRRSFQEQCAMYLAVGKRCPDCPEDPQ